MNKKINKKIPISVFTGFLGSGKTTLLNKIIQTNPHIKFGLIINEFGEIGIDGQILDNSKEEIVEMSNGCMCCVVRSDLIQVIEKMVDSGKVDYILIETSGLAEPMPILQTFMSMNADKCLMDAMITVVDCVNYQQHSLQFATVLDQIKLADILLLNKVEEVSEKELVKVTKNLQDLNSQASIVINTDELPINLLIETNRWNVEKLINIEKEEHSHNHEHHDHDHSNHDHSHNHHEHHHHEHEDIQEVVWKTKSILDPNKMDYWLQNHFPQEAIRAKGILQLQTPNQIKSFVFQMVGANKVLIPLEEYTNKKVEYSCIVFIGKDLNQTEILKTLDQLVEAI
jgi:G3E family GTPase